MNNQKRYQYKIDIVDVENNSIVGSKIVTTADEAIEVLKLDVNLWIQDYEFIMRRREQEAKEELETGSEYDLMKCGMCGRSDDDPLLYTVDGKNVCFRCHEQTLAEETELANLEELIEINTDYDQVVAEQQSSNKPHTQTI